MAIWRGTLIMLFRWFERSQVYHPSRALDATGAELGHAFEDIAFEAEDGVKLNAWWYPAEAAATQSHLTMLICHGNGGNISHRLELYRTLLGMGLGVFAFDYRGYGRSEGRPSEAGTYRDAQAACRWLKKRGMDGKQIIAYGESLGGAVAAELCIREDVAGLVLQSAFTSIADIGVELYPWLPVRWLNSIRYDTRSKLRRMHVPVVVLHSRVDGLIGFRHAEANFAAANEPKKLCEISGEHNDPLLNRSEFTAGIRELLSLIRPASRSLAATSRS